MKESMGKKGASQGNMSPKVVDYQEPMSVFSQKGFSKVDEYIERQDAHQKSAAKQVEKQDYKGRYN